MFVAYTRSSAGAMHSRHANGPVRVLPADDSLKQRTPVCSDTTRASSYLMGQENLQAIGLTALEIERNTHVGSRGDDQVLKNQTFDFEVLAAPTRKVRTAAVAKNSPIMVITATGRWSATPATWVLHH